MPKQEKSKNMVFFNNPSPEILNFDDQIDTNTALHNAILERDHAKLARALEKADAKLITAISCENSPLLLACKLADKKAAEMILKKMTQLEEEKAFPVNEAVNEKGPYGMTALHWASFYKFNDLCELLIYLMADNQAKTKDNKSVEYFSTHQFVPANFLVYGEIAEGHFHLSVSSLSDIAFHADKIALNLNLTTPKEVMKLFKENELAQMGSANRFLLFFQTFAPRLIDWLDVTARNQKPLDLQSRNCD